MNGAEIKARLANTESKIRIEEDYAVPVSGQVVPLPYMVMRSREEVHADDCCRVAVARIFWTAALFTKERAPGLEKEIQTALRNCRVERVEVETYPDGTPYQTNFYFETTERR